MLDSVIATLENALVRYETSGDIPGPIGTRHPSITPFQAFPTSNGHVIIAVGNDKLWLNFCKALKMDDLLEDPRFVTNEKRNEHQPEIEEILNKILKDQSTEYWLDLLEKKGIPAARINNMKDLFADPQVAARNMLIPVEGDQDTRVSVAGNPVKMSNHASPQTRPPAPVLGRDTYAILQEFGYTEDEVQKFVEKGVI
jgi:CoA:oxalate CoA-transferase